MADPMPLDELCRVIREAADTLGEPLLVSGFTARRLARALVEMVRRYERLHAAIYHDDEVPEWPPKEEWTEIQKAAREEGVE